MMSAEPQSGQRGSFHWVHAPRATLSALLLRCPELVVGRFVAVTSFDSGPLRLEPTDLAAGWRNAGAIAYSPRISAVAQLAMGEWDEWYVLAEARQLGTVDVFVNDAGFSPIPHPGGGDGGRSPADEFDPYAAARVERFGAQLEANRPLTWVAEGDALSVVVSDEGLARRVLEAVLAEDARADGCSAAASPGPGRK